MRARWPSGLFVMRKLSPPGWIATSRVSFEMSTPTLCAIVDLISFSVLVLSRGHDPRVSVQAAGKREGWSNYRSVLSDWRAHDPSPPAAGLCRKKASGARSCRIRRENDKTRRAFRPLRRQGRGLLGPLDVDPRHSIARDQRPLRVRPKTSPVVSRGRTTVGFGTLCLESNNRERPMQRRDLNAPDAYLPVAAYTQAIEVSGASRTLYISGQIGQRWMARSPTTLPSRAASLGKISKRSSRPPA